MSYREQRYWMAVWTARGFISEGIYRYHNGNNHERDTQYSGRRRRQH